MIQLFNKTNHKSKFRHFFFNITTIDQKVKKIVVGFGANWLVLN